VGALLCCAGVREDELLCEEASAHLAHCCPGFDATKMQCTYVSGCGTTTYPALSVAMGRCILGEDCADLVAGSVCERAPMAVPVQQDEGGAKGTFAEVCP